MIKQLFTLICNLFILGNVCSQPLTNSVAYASIVNKPPYPPDANCDYYVDYHEAQAMIAYYIVHHKPNRIQTNFKIEKSILIAIKHFLDNNRDSYDGVRFFFGAKKSWFLAPTKATFIVVPTKLRRNPTDYEKHENIWGPVINFGSQRSQDLKLNQSKEEAEEEINDFGEKFRGEQVRGDRESAPNTGKARLSIGVWVSKCKIDSIVKILESNESLNGVVALAASYYKPDTRISERKFLDQSTLIFVPTDSTNEPLWTVVPKPLDAVPKDAGLNHGSLCPNICN
jgi:hypothetical protein